MPWNALKTWTTEILTSTDMNAQIRDNAGFLKNIFDSYTVFRDEKAANTAGQALTNATWVTRQINIKEGDVANNLTLASNQITFTPGIYYVSFTVSGSNGSAGLVNHKLRFRNVAGAVTLLSGGNTGIGANDGATVSMEGIINIATTTTLDVQHYVSGATQSGGAALNAGETEVYLMGIVIRLDDV